VTDLILVGEEAGGTVGGELAFSVADDDLEEALQGTWSNSPSITVDHDRYRNLRRHDHHAHGRRRRRGIRRGMLTLTQNLRPPANNKLARVNSSTATTIVYPAATFSADAAQIPVGASVRQVGFQGASADIAAVTAGGNGLTSTVLDFTTLGISVGEWVKVGDGDNANCSFATPANNGFCRVSAVAAQGISFDRVPSGWAADTGTGKTISVFSGDFLTNASTKRLQHHRAAVSRPLAGDL
jgi:hypothetical protein